jgi:GTP-binding protein
VAGIPRVVIVGYPNAGKSTLFNRLLGRRKALVHALPGMTRDRVSATAVIEGRRVEIVDTGGFFDTGGESLSAEVKARAWEAARGAGVLVLVLDGRRGLLPVEEDLYRSLRKLDRPVVVAVNKIDSERERPMQGEYFRLGAAHLFFVSAEHRLGLDELEAGIAASLPADAAGVTEESEGPRPLAVALIGRTNVGKSSLANRLCGEERFIVHELPGTTRDSGDVLLLRGESSYRLIDTAGIRKLRKVGDERESAGVIKARKNIPQADVLCLVLDVTEFPTRQDAAVARLAFASLKPLLLALNKWDLVRDDRAALAEARRACLERLDFVGYAPLIPVSALTGKGVARVLETAGRVFGSAQKRVGTPELNRFVARVQAANPPTSRKGRRFKLKYMTQRGVLPPTFLAFTSGPTAFAPAYEKYFLQKMREAFGFEGTPLRVILRSSSPERFI